jgi:anti-sigma regulatory factor (Ser/Thr protein kinase)
MTAMKPSQVHPVHRRDWPLRSDLPDPRQGVPAFGALPSAPAMARSHVRQVLGEWGLGSFTEDAALIVSELVTNVVDAARGADGDPVYLDDGTRLPFMRLGLRSDEETLLIVVEDRAPGIPVQKDVALDAESGRGLLMIVDALTGGKWGWYPAPESKVVWAVLRASR